MRGRTKNIKLTEAAVRFIRSNYKKLDRKFGFKALGRKFGVSDEACRDAYRKTTWKHIK